MATGPRAAALTHLLKSQTTQNLLSPKRIPLQLTSDEVEPLSSFFSLAGWGADLNADWLHYSAHQDGSTTVWAPAASGHTGAQSEHRK